MTSGRNSAVDPRLLTEGSSQHLRYSSNTQESSFFSSSDSFLASSGSLPLTEVDQLVAYLRTLEGKHDQAIARLQRHEERLNKLEERREYDGDDESDGSVVHVPKRRRRKKNRAKKARILTEGNVRDLSDEQQKVRSEIKVCTHCLRLIHHFLTIHNLFSPLIP